MAVSIETLVAEATAVAPPTDSGAETMRAGVLAAEGGLKAARASKVATVDLRQERTERKQRWLTKGVTLRAEEAADRKMKALRFSKGTSKVNLDEHAAAIGTAANVQTVIADVVAEIEGTIAEAERAEKSAAYNLKLAEREYFYAAGLEAAWQANRAWLPLLELEGNVEINMNDSRVAAFVKEILRIDNELQQGMVN